MELLSLLGYFLALLIGISLGLVGSGGSILTVPILVYLLGLDPITATGYSLFVVGATALVGGVRNAVSGNVHFATAAVFGIPSLLASYLVRAYALPALPDKITSVGTFVLTKALVLMVLFAIIMIVAAVKMIRTAPVHTGDTEVSIAKLAISGSVTGLLAGAVGAGGGFLIIPALIFLAGLSMRLAASTSLLIIAIQSLAGFFGDSKLQQTDWPFLVTYTTIAIAGLLIGIRASKKINGEKLKTGFGYFILLMGGYILLKELVL